MPPERDPLIFAPSFASVLTQRERDRYGRRLKAPSIVLTSCSLADPSDSVVLVSRGKSTPHNLASIVKLLAGVVAEDSILAGKTNLEDKITLQAEDLPSGVLRLGDRLSMRDLMILMLLRSNGAAALALARHVGTHFGSQADALDAQTWFLSRMRNRATNFELTNTHLDTIPGNTNDVLLQRSNAEDVAKLGQHVAIGYPLIKQFSGTSSSEVFLPIYGEERALSHTCKAVMDHPSWNIFAKSGTMQTNSIVAVAVVGNRCFSMASLGSEVRTRKRIKDINTMKQLIERFLDRP